MNSDHFLRVGAAVMVGLLVGCSQSGETNGGDTLPPGSSVSATAPSGPVVSPPATQPPATTPGPTGTAPNGTAWSADQQQIVDAYLQFDNAFHRAVIAGNQADAELLKTAEGDLLKAIQVDMLNRETRGIKIRPGEPRVNRTVPVSVDVTGDRAIVVGCEINNDVVVAADGRIINGDLVTTRSRYRFARSNGTWKAAAHEEGQEWKGDEEAACVASQ